MSVSIIASRIHHASVEIEVLTSLVQAIVERIETIGQHFDPAQAARAVADLARIVLDYLAKVLAELLAIEEDAAVVPGQIVTVT